MILIMVLMMTIFLGGIVIGQFEMAQQAERYVTAIYLKRQAYWKAVSGLKLVGTVLQYDDPSYDALSEAWARPLVIPLKEGEIRIQIEDEERYLNLNCLENSSVEKALGRLLILTKTESISTEEIKAWIGQSPYLSVTVPNKNAPFDSPYELLILGMSEKDFYGKTIAGDFYPGLGSLVTTFSNGRVNLNTAPAYILMALSVKIDRTLAERLITYRRKKPLKRLEDLLQVEGFDLDILHDLRPLGTVRSENFRVKIQVRAQGEEGELEAIINRKQGLKIIFWRFS